jgi:hypothetical protein
VVSAIYFGIRLPLGKASLCWGETLPGGLYPGTDKTKKIIKNLKLFFYYEGSGSRFSAKVVVQSGEGSRIASQNSNFHQSVHFL